MKPRKLATWTMIASIIMNRDDFHLQIAAPVGLKRNQTGGSVSGNDMKTLLKPLSVLAAVFLLAGCSTAQVIQKRIAKYPELFEQLGENHRLLVQEGRIAEGMNKNAVFLAWGPPEHVAQGSKEGKTVETWTYGGGYRYGGPRVNIGYGYGGYGYGRGRRSLLATALIFPSAGTPTTAMSRMRGWFSPRAR